VTIKISKVASNCASTRIRSTKRLKLSHASRMLHLTLSSSSAYQTVDPSLAAGEARKQATIAETKIYDEAQSTVRSLETSLVLTD
jgi:hypothetical protein